MIAYAELAVTTNFSFLRGASHPGELVATADEIGLAAIGIADRNSFAGVVRAYEEWKRREEERRQADHAGAARESTVKLLVGTRLVISDGFEVLAYPTDREAYGRLCRLLTHGNVRSGKGRRANAMSPSRMWRPPAKARCSSSFPPRRSRPSSPND
jgi:error-prone DNA polymerase